MYECVYMGEGGAYVCLSVWVCLCVCVLEEDNGNQPFPFFCILISCGKWFCWTWYPRHEVLPSPKQWAKQPCTETRNQFQLCLFQLALWDTLSIRHKVSTAHGLLTFLLEIALKHGVLGWVTFCHILPLSKLDPKVP